MLILDVYTDGTYDKREKVAGWGFIGYVDGTEVVRKKGKIFDPPTWQVAGEMQAVIEAVKYAQENNYLINIFHDLKHLYCWVQEIDGKKSWKTNSEETKKYKNFILSRREFINKFIKVKGHSGNFGNDAVDEFIKK